MKLLLVFTVITLAHITDVLAKKVKTKEFGDNELKDYVTQAKHLVDTPYLHSRNKLKSRMKRDSNNISEIIAFLKQAAGETRNCIRAADYQELTLQLVTEKLKEIHPSPFNVSDVLTDEQKDILNRLRGCAYQFLPKVCPNSKYRSINGECNNKKDPSLGAANTAFYQSLPPEYEDGISLPRGWIEGRKYHGHHLPNTREVSNKIVRYTKHVYEDIGRAQTLAHFGQFLDYDMTLTPDTPSTSTFFKAVDCDTSCVKAYPCFPIPIPDDDPRINNLSDCFPFFRSAPACNLNSPVRKQMNAQSSPIDASQVYGSDKTVANKLRNMTSDLGLMAVNQNFTDNDQSFLPFNDKNGDPCIQANKTAGIPCFLAGDIRVGEQIGLSAIQTIFLRQHNHIATALQKLNPHWSGEVLYQESRNIIACIIQKIAYKDWLPLVLGSKMDNVLPPYTGYNEKEDPRIANVFTIALSFRHTMVYPIVELLNKKYQTVSSIPFHKTFFASWILVKGGVDPILRGFLARFNKLNVQDRIVDDELRDSLFVQVKRIALDLAAINMQRGRDHGLPAYNAWRRFCGLSAPKNLEELAHVLKNAKLAKDLLKLYGTPENIDLWLGGVIEPLVPGGRTGELFSCIIGEQFKRTRDADRFFYMSESVLTPDQRRSIETVTLSGIICATTGITEVPKNAFLGNTFPEDFVPCANIPKLDLSYWKDNSKPSDNE